MDLKYRLPGEKKLRPLCKSLGLTQRGNQSELLQRIEGRGISIGDILSCVKNNHSTPQRDLAEELRILKRQNASYYALPEDIKDIPARSKLRTLCKKLNMKQCGTKLDLAKNLLDAGIPFHAIVQMANKASSINAECPTSNADTPPNGGVVEEVWIKPEPIEGECTEYFQIKCEDDIADADTFTETVRFVQETVCKSEFICDDDGSYYESLSSSVNATSKKRISGGNTPYTCNECGKVFAFRWSYKRHASVHSGLKPYPCDMCGMRFKQKAHLVSHHLTHSREKPYTCAYCGSSFPYKNTIKRHMESHRKKGNWEANDKHFINGIYKCDECPQKFTRKCNFKIHKQLHAGDAHFECGECGKTFTQKSSLNRHVFMHSGEKPFECEICGSRFSQNAHLKAHQRQHTGEKPYSCDHCGEHFMYGNNLKRHMKRKHIELIEGHTKNSPKCLTALNVTRNLNEKGLTIHSQSMKYVPHPATNVINGLETERD